MNTNTSGSDSAAKWTWEEDKLFEDPEDSANRWDKIATRLGTKSSAEVEQHYAVLLEDLAAIEAGRIELPAYVTRSSESQMCPKSDKKHMGVQRKSGKLWTEEGHSWTEKYGRGDWKSISRYVVLGRTPSQVASHAQKYFERQEKDDRSPKQEKTKNFLHFNF